jgi:RND family efflux transporter MFP subunit
VVSAGEEVVILARPDVKEAVIDLPAGLAETLPEGVEFHVQAQLDPTVATTGTLRELEPRPDSATRTRRARLTLRDSPAGLRLGTAISVTLSANIAQRLEVPETALQEVDGKIQVWLVDAQSQTVNPREVRVLSRNRGVAVLGSGVQAGERVVSAGVNSLKPGQKIKLDEASRQ